MSPSPEVNPFPKSETPPLERHDRHDVRQHAEHGDDR